MPTSPLSKPLSITLWLAQGVLALVYVGGGIYKLVMSLATLAAMWPWAGEHPALLRVTSLLDIAGGVGVLLPALTRIKPELTRLAAAGLILLQLGAIAFHFLRGEQADTPFNFFLLALALFVFWKYRAN